ncbi:MAG: hypothetical protein CMH69_04900 [Nitratireductor sp.]|nr:hypothetical protein [Nitratireductor sp.]
MQLKSKALCIAASVFFVPPAHSEEAAFFGDREKITVTGGENIYKAICQGCHMPDGKGASGAGRYPSLAENKNLEHPEYAIFVIKSGQKAMPAMENLLSDQQIADVVAYIRTNFGNDYSGEVSVDQIAPPWP